MSSLDSATVALLSPVIGPTGLLLLGGSAATQATLDAAERGASDGQALTMGLLAGGFEALFEKIPFDRLVGEPSEKILKSILQQGLTEGMEEAGTTVANAMADIIVMADNSKYRQEAAALMAKGMSSNQAWLQVLGGIAAEAGYDFLGGMLSGGTMQLGKSAGQTIANRRSTKIETVPEAEKPGDDAADKEYEDYLSALQKAGYLSETAEEFRFDNRNRNSATDVSGQGSNGIRSLSYKELPPDAYFKDGRVYDYDFLVAQDPIAVIDTAPSLAEVQTDGKVDPEKVIALGVANLKENGGAKSGDVFLINNTYTRRTLQVGQQRIKHGLYSDSVYARKTNARLGAIVGDLCRNAIPINGLPNTHNVRGTYAMMAPVLLDVGGTNRTVVALITIEQQTNRVESIGFVDVAHAISGRPLKADDTTKKENRVARSQRAGTKSDSVHQFSTISIRDFLGIVNETHQGFLSDDVISHLGVERRGDKKGLFSEREGKKGFDLEQMLNHSSLKDNSPGHVTWQATTPESQLTARQRARECNFSNKHRV